MVLYKYYSLHLWNPYQSMLPLQKVRAKSPKKRLHKTKEIPPPPSIPSPMNTAKSHCKICSPIPGHLKPVELVQLSYDERTQAIDKAWEVIGAAEGILSCFALCTCHSLPQAHRFTIWTSAFWHCKTDGSIMHQESQVWAPLQVWWHCSLCNNAMLRHICTMDKWLLSEYLHITHLHSTINFEILVPDNSMGWDIGRPHLSPTWTLLLSFVLSPHIKSKSLKIYQ